MIYPGGNDKFDTSYSVNQRIMPGWLDSVNDQTQTIDRCQKMAFLNWRYY